jgi:hypothetical protein
MRLLAKPGGRSSSWTRTVAEEFGAVGDLMERLFYGFSITLCLPDGMSHQPSAGTGMVMRPSALDTRAKGRFRASGRSPA